MSFFSVINGLLNNVPTPVRATGTNELAVEIGGSNVSAFGDIIAVDYTPVIQIDFVYGINFQTGYYTVVNSASCDTFASRLRLQTLTNSAGQATYQSKRVAKYRPGQGNTARFTAVWTTSAINSTQIIGMGNTTDGYFFGLSGTGFGILRRNSNVNTWISQSSWNSDRCDGTGSSGFSWNFNNGNVMQIRYPFLGYGDIKYYVQNSINGAWILCHTEQYANNNILPQVSNPNLTFYANVTNSGNTTNLTMYVGSVGVFVSSKKEYLGAQYATSNIKTLSTTPINIFSIKNCTTYNTVANRAFMRLRALSVASGNGSTNGSITQINILSGATLSGIPTFVPVNGGSPDNGVTLSAANSIVSVDVSASQVINGVSIFNTCIANNTNIFIDLTSYEIFVTPGDIFTITATSLSATPVCASLTWNED